MRRYSVLEFPDKAKKAFAFLTHEYNWEITEDSEFTFSYITEYVKADFRIRFNYDHRDNFFYFVIIKGLNTKYPNDLDNLNIKALYKVFQKFDNSIDAESLQPDNSQYEEALNRNAELLRKYMSRILNGEGWPE